MSSGRELQCQIAYRSFGEMMLYVPAFCRDTCRLIDKHREECFISPDDIKPIIDYFLENESYSPTYADDIRKLVLQIKRNCYGSPREVFEVLLRDYDEEKINEKEYNWD